MTYVERLARVLLVILGLGLVGLVAWLVVGLASDTLPFRAKPDPQTGTAGLLVETDAGTGCQYIVTPWGGIVPRMGRDGRILCGPARP